MLFVKYFKNLRNIELPQRGAAVKNRKAHAEGIFGYRKRGASGSNPRFGYKKIRNTFAFRITFWLPHGQRLRNAPCGRFSEQSLAQRSKIARRMPKGFLGTARGELRVRIRAGIKKQHRQSRCCYVMVAPRGFEPRQTESESAVLPLHNRAISNVLYYYIHILSICQ